MLNCCIEHKKKRDQLHKGYTGEMTYYSGNTDFGPSTSRISRTFSDEGEEEGGEGEIRGFGSSSDDDEFFECDDEQTSEKVSENLTEEKEIDESVVHQSDDDSMENQSNTVEETSDNVVNQSTGMTGIDVNNQLDVEQMTENDNLSEIAQTSVDRSDSQSRIRNDNQSRTVIETDNRSETGIESQPRDSISSVSVQSDSAFQETFTHKPEGRLAPFQDLTLVNCNEKMYIPVTQEPAPMTEDMLEEHAEILAK